jgi:hypothetical protein
MLAFIIKNDLKIRRPANTCLRKRLTNPTFQKILHNNYEILIRLKSQFKNPEVLTKRMEDERGTAGVG